MIIIRKNTRNAFRWVILLVSLTYSLSAFAESDPPLKRTVSGYLKDLSSGESLIGATVFISELRTGVVTNSYGFYSVTLPPGNYLFRFSYVGYTSQERHLVVEGNLTQNVSLEPAREELGEVVVTGDRAGQDLVAPVMSMVRISQGAIGRVPAFLGRSTWSR